MLRRLTCRLNVYDYSLIDCMTCKDVVQKVIDCMTRIDIASTNATKHAPKHENKLCMVYGFHNRPFTSPDGIQLAGLLSRR